MSNSGKKFEKDIVTSCPDYVLVKRLNDNTSAWSGGERVKYSSRNECDFIMFNDKTQIFYGLELKSTKHDSFTYWKEGYHSKTTLSIKKHQILGLQKWDTLHKGCFGFLFNFEKYENRTFFVSISNFLSFTRISSKRSINLKDVLQMNPIEIGCRKLKVNYRYDMDAFFTQTKERIHDGDEWI